MQYKCSQCDKFFPSVKKKTDHERRVHPKAETPITPVTESKLTPEPKVKGKTFEVKAPTKREKQETSQSYHCVDCGATVTKGQSSCSCGATLDWSQL